MGSVATVRFDADASPQRRHAAEARLGTRGVNRVLIGDRATLSITSPTPAAASPPASSWRADSAGFTPREANWNTASATCGREKSRKLQLQLTAVQPGATTNVLAARGAGNLRAEDRFRLEVAAPQLDVSMIGPRRRYLEHPAVYQVAISNPGTAPAEQVELVAQLPSGLKFVSANNSGHYDEVQRAVHCGWRNCRPTSAASSRW